MAADELNETPETALPKSFGKGRKGAPSRQYEELIEWAIEQEQANPALRIITLISDDENAPEAQRLTYSYPVVKAGANGYEAQDCGIVTK